jgi:hypothetical protein
MTMKTESNKITAPATSTSSSRSRKERLISGLRQRIGVTEDIVSDEELLEKTKNTLSRAIVDLEIATADFAKAATPEVVKIATDINKAFTKIRTDR